MTGSTTFGSLGQVTHVGCGVAMVHRLWPGPTKVTFGRPVDLLDLDGATVKAGDTTQWAPDPPLHRAEVVFYRRHERP